MSSLERRYRTLMLAYPADYRAARQDEILDTLLQAAETRPDRPQVREAWDLVQSGLGVRLEALGSRGLHAGRAQAALMSAFIATLITSAVLSQGATRGAISERPVIFALMWLPHVVLIVLFALAPVSASGRTGRVLLVLCGAGVIFGSEVTMTARLLTFVLVVCELMMVTAPLAVNTQRTRIVVNRCLVLGAGLVAGVGATSRVNAIYPDSYARATLWGGLPYPTGAAIALLSIAGLIALLICVAKPSVAVTVGLMFLPAAVMAIMLTGNTVYLAPTVINGARGALGAVLATALIYYGLRRSTRMPELSSSGGVDRAPN